MKDLYYWCVLYEKDRIIPMGFNGKEEADDFLFANHLHAYVTIKTVKEVMRDIYPQQIKMDFMGE